jgi:hypothetical protein
MLALYSYLTATLHTLQQPQRVRDQRGLSQSTENAILLAGAVGIAVLIISAITAYVQANLPS